MTPPTLTPGEAALATLRQSWAWQFLAATDQVELSALLDTMAAAAIEVACEGGEDEVNQIIDTVPAIITPTAQDPTEAERAHCERAAIALNDLAADYDGYEFVAMGTDHILRERASVRAEVEQELSKDWVARAEVAPVPKHILCPKCGLEHIDRGEWETKLHRSHLCEGCQHVWRPFEYFTVGVGAINR